jgi:hypothetical protein
MFTGFTGPGSERKSIRVGKKIDCRTDSLIDLSGSIHRIESLDQHQIDSLDIHEQGCEDEQGGALARTRHGRVRPHLCFAHRLHVA